MSLAASPDASASQDPRTWLEQNVTRITATVGHIARRRRLSAQDHDEVLSLLWTHLARDDYRVLRRYRGSASIMGYLAVVIERVLLDWRTASWGKWRPSARARRLGRRAVAFERMVVRDGRSSEQAQAYLKRTTGETVSEETAAALARREPRRRRQFVELQDLFAADSAGVDPWMALVDAHHARRGARVARLLEHVLGALPESDQVLLRMRHEQGLKVSQIAQMLDEDQRRLYRRLDAVHAKLRHRLIELGLSRVEALEIAGSHVAHVPPVLTRAALAC